MTTDIERLTLRIVLNAMLPVLKVLVEDDPKIKKRFRHVNGKIQFKTFDENEAVGSYLIFSDGSLDVKQGFCEQPDITFSFSTPAKMNAFFSGKNVLPKISGFMRPVLLIKMFLLLLGMKLLMPDVRPKDYEKRKLKVKMAFFMVTTALSQYNKGGDPEMVKWTSGQPERIYQITVEPEGIAAYLRVKAGKSKAGRGVYKKRRPFVHLKFNGVEGAFPVVMNDIDLVTAMKKGLLVVEGSPEYGRDLGNFMDRIQALVT